MKNILEYKVILWDFDGVIMDSMPIRGRGFEEVLKEYPKEQVLELMEFHNINGGLSRYVKFKYFFETIRGETITDEEVMLLASNFSDIMLSLLLDKKLLIKDSLNFIMKYAENYPMHIVSGSDGKELRTICKELELEQFFKTINGSPTPKKELVAAILKDNDFVPNQVVLIGDSINDYEAAIFNSIDFIGYNNLELLNITQNYVHNFSSIML